MTSSLQLTNEQAIALAQATGLGETRGMHVAMLLWPLVRDMVLEAAALRCKPAAKELWDNQGGLMHDDAFAVAALIEDRIRAMKGKP